MTTCAQLVGGVKCGQAATHVYERREGRVVVERLPLCDVCSEGARAVIARFGGGHAVVRKLETTEGD